MIKRKLGWREEAKIRNEVRKIKKQKKGRVRDKITYIKQRENNEKEN